MISNVREVEARNGRIIAIATDGDAQIQQIAEDVIYVPETREEFSPMVNVVALQLLAYYAAQARGTDIDVIALPTAGHHGFLDAVRGSTTERVVRQAPCSVLAVPV